MDGWFGPFLEIQIWPEYQVLWLQLLLLLLFTDNNQSPIEPTLLLLSNHIYCTSKQASKPAPRVLQASNFKAHLLLLLLFVCLFVCCFGNWLWVQISRRNSVQISQPFFLCCVVKHATHPTTVVVLLLKLVCGFKSC